MNEALPTSGGRRLEGRVAAITASTRSIGRGIAEAFIAEGASVMINGRSAEKGAAALSEIGAGDALAFHQGSATEQAAVEGLVDATVATFGKLDIMVLNAGGVDKPAPVIEMTNEEWQYELDLNLNHTFWGTRKALQHMVPNGWGRIIAISSIEGKTGKPNIAGYTANKHAINGFVKAVAREVGVDGVTVNAICPGLVITDMVHERAGGALGVDGVEGLIAHYCADTALKRPVTIEEVAAFAVHLASDAGAGFTGGTISIDGGDSYY
ncbi:MAG: SDR family NAD(P)-dependent oxidoreductase [Acidimicrobiales bacterium]